MHIHTDILTTLCRVLIGLARKGKCVQETERWWVGVQKRACWEIYIISQRNTYRSLILIDKFLEVEC